MLSSPEPIAPHAPATPDDIDPDQLQPARGAARKMWLAVLMGLLALVATVVLLLHFGPLADAAGGCGGG